MGNEEEQKKRKVSPKTTEKIPYHDLIGPAVAWYPNHHRDLPWRRTRDPYRIWVSEIMLQQTRVEAVIPYYERFTAELPTIRALADCPEDRLLKLWEGLGYYSRVRNLQKAARILVKENDGRMFPDHDRILSLPGIGPYTAGAISSIAFGLPYSAIDGNALRILTRVNEDRRNINLDRTKKAITSEMDDAIREFQKELSSENSQPVMRNRTFFPDPSEMESETEPASRTDSSRLPGILNQALMEIGATVCVPNAAPKCEACPWGGFCRTRKDGPDAWQELPVKDKPKKRRIEDRTILLIRDGERTILQKRPEKGLLAGLYEFPGLPGHVSEKEAVRYAEDLGLLPLYIEKGPEAKHIFSHVEWHMTSFVIRVAEVTGGNNFLLADLHEAREKYAIPGAFRKYAEYLWGSTGEPLHL